MQRRVALALTGISGDSDGRFKLAAARRTKDDKAGTRARVQALRRALLATDRDQRACTALQNLIWVYMILDS